MVGVGCGGCDAAVLSEELGGGMVSLGWAVNLGRGRGGRGRKRSRECGLGGRAGLRLCSVMGRAQGLNGGDTTYCPFTALPGRQTVRAETDHRGEKNVWSGPRWGWLGAGQWRVGWW